MPYIEIRVRDRVGVVSEVSGVISSLGLHIRKHNARVIQDRSGAEISVFRAELTADEAELRLLRTRLCRIRGFLSFTLIGKTPSPS